MTEELLFVQDDIRIVQVGTFLEVRSVCCNKLLLYSFDESAWHCSSAYCDNETRSTAMGSILNLASDSHCLNA